jgi:uncharacterized membrane protein
MTPGNALKVYGISTAVFFAVDMIWLGVVAKQFYRRQLSGLLRPDVQWLPAIVFYLLFVGGLVFFAIAPALERASIGRAAATGALFGVIAYATYDLTSLALIRNFPPMVAAVDMAWGAVLAGVVSVAGYGFGRWLGA